MSQLIESVDYLKYEKEADIYFIGKRIQEIYYEDIDYLTEIEEGWKYSKSIHSIDMIIYLVFQDKTILQVSWGTEFGNYGLQLRVVEKIEVREGCFLHNKIEYDTNWKNLIKKPLTQVEVFWEEWYSLNNGEREAKSLIPMSIEIRFGDCDYVWISCIELREDKFIAYFADHLTVLFDRAEAINYKLLKE